MSQCPLCPNLSQKVQKEVSQMANRNLPIAMLYRWFKCKLKPPNNFNSNFNVEDVGDAKTGLNSVKSKSELREWLAK